MPNHQVRRDSKQQQIVRDIAGRIRCGQWPPGAKLPTRVELEKEFQVTTVTLQQAFDVLKRNGFVVSKGRWGTYVADDPPCYNTYALAFPTHPGDDHSWSRFYWALTQGASALARENNCTINTCYDIDPPADSEPCRQLQADIHSGRLAGIIFANVPFPLAGTPIVADDGVPRVAVMSNLFSGHPHIGAVYPDNRSFINRAARRLAERGCGRVAVITGHRFGDAPLTELLETAPNYGLTIKPQWIQGNNPHDPQWVIHTLMLLMQGPAESRPDGLIVMDDHFVPHIETGVAHCGLAVPDDLSIVALANFPADHECSMPILRLGFASHEILSICVEQLSAQREGRKTEPVTRIPAIFEDEWFACYHPDQALIGTTATMPTDNRLAPF